MYEAEKAAFEQELARCELTPTPGNFWLAAVDNPEDGETKIIVPVDGKCCALSPMMLKHQTRSPYHLSLLYPHMSGDWFIGVVGGFDGAATDDDTETYRDGYEWGQLMRARYTVLPATADEDAQ